VGSQYGEHEFVLKHFKEQKGRFLDIGAHDGKSFSNTWPLTEIGWTGVLVEPSPWVFPNLIKNYEGREGFEFICAPVVAELIPGVIEWYDCGGDYYSTTKIGHRDRIQQYDSSRRFMKLWLSSLRLHELMLAFPRFDYINIDVEGDNHNLLRMIGWLTERYPTLKPEMLCVEMDPKVQVLEVANTIFHDWYKHQIGGNLLLWKS